MLYVTNTKPLCMLLLKTCKNFHTNSVQNKYAWKPEWVNDEKLFLVSPWFTTNGSAQRAALHVWFGRFFMYLFIWLNSGYPFWHKGICVSSWDWTTDLSFLKWKVQNWAKKKKKTLIFLSIYMCFCFWVQWSWPVEIINYIVGFLFEFMLDAFLPSQLKWAFPSDRVKCGSVPVTNPLTAA